jgi:hypothetical protein
MANPRRKPEGALQHAIEALTREEAIAIASEIARGEEEYERQTSTGEPVSLPPSVTERLAALKWLATIEGWERKAQAKNTPKVAKLGVYKP